MDNKELKDIYIKFKHILSGCRSIYDSLYFAQDIINKHPESKLLINGMIHGKTYEKVFDFRNIAYTLNVLNNFEYRNEINDYINNNVKENYDYIQINAFMRIAKNKKNIISDTNNDNKIYKLNTHIYKDNIDNNDNNNDKDDIDDANLMSFL